MLYEFFPQKIKGEKTFSDNHKRLLKVELEKDTIPRSPSRNLDGLARQLIPRNYFDLTCPDSHGMMC